jgi:hypothetical protein
MAEPSLNPAQPVSESETPITNGTPAVADVEMADSAPAPVPAQEVSFLFFPLSRLGSNSPPPDTRRNPHHHHKHRAPPTYRPDRASYTNTRTSRPAPTASIVAQQPTSQRAGSASAYAAYTAWKPDEGVSEPVCDAAFAGGDEAFGDDRAGEAAQVVE